MIGASAWLIGINLNKFFRLHIEPIQPFMITAYPNGIIFYSIDDKRRRSSPFGLKGASCVIDVSIENEKARRVVSLCNHDVSFNHVIFDQ
jgi:hypothetical protein